MPQFWIELILRVCVCVCITTEMASLVPRRQLYSCNILVAAHYAIYNFQTTQLYIHTHIYTHTYTHIRRTEWKQNLPRQLLRKMAQENSTSNCFSAAIFGT